MKTFTNGGTNLPLILPVNMGQLTSKQSYEIEKVSGSEPEIDRGSNPWRSTYHRLGSYNLANGSKYELTQITQLWCLPNMLRLDSRYWVLSTVTYKLR